MTVMHVDPFRDLKRLTVQALAHSRGPRALPMEALRRGDGFLIPMDVPCVDPADVEVSVERNVVTVRAHREPLHEHGDELLVDERPTGDFSRQFLLGQNLDATQLSADFHGGVLLLRIPVAEASKPRKFEISSRRGESHTVEAGSAEPSNVLERTTMNTQPKPDAPSPARFRGIDRRPIAAYDSYREAERAVDYLSDSGFPVQRVAIVGSDLKLVEQVVGRLNYGGAALRGAASGAFAGLLIGWLFGLFNWSVLATFALALYGLLFGAVLGAIFGLAMHALQGGRRDFASVQVTTPSHYEIVADEEVADQARAMIATMSGGV